MTKFYVIALSDSFVADFGQVSFGSIVSSHADASKADEVKDKHNKRMRVSSKDRHFGVIPSDMPLVKGTVYPDLAAKCVAEKFDADAIYTMKCVLDPTWQGKVITDEAIGWLLEDLGIGMDELREKYEGRAWEQLDAQQVNKVEQAEARTRVKAVGEALSTARSQFTYTFPAVAGIQAGRVYYSAQVPYAALVKLFTFDTDDLVPADLRAQRVMNERRAEAIGDYVLANPETYILPSLTASVSAEMTFEPVPVPGAAASIGLLHIPMEATMLINDGQHRRRGIERALTRSPKLRDETIAVSIFFDQGLERSQQMFADINGKQVKPSSAINALYDRRNPFNAWVLGIIGLMPEVAPRIDLENSSVGAKSYKLWSLVAFKKFLTLLTGISENNIEKVEPWLLREMDTFMIDFFAECRGHIPGWGNMVSGHVAAVDVRENFVIGHAVWLEALAVFARRALFAKAATNLAFTEEGVIRPDMAEWDCMKALMKVDQHKSSLMWANRCVVLGKMQKTSDGVKSTAARLLSLANIRLDADMQALENKLAA